MIADILVFIMGSLGITIAVISAANMLQNCCDYSSWKSPLIAGVFLGLTCFLINRYNLTLVGFPVLSSKMVYLISVAVCFNFTTLLIFSPFYLISVFFSPFSIWFAALSLSCVLVTCYWSRQKIHTLFFIVLSVLPLSFSEIICYGY
ncbi:MAG TPA: hypothetical protein DCY75_04440, partial [Clostridiales bacterium]|nr:hypothetical protein [Clostridiales bacterium]